MLKYEFSKREKALLCVLAVILIGLLWYQFVFVNVNSQIEQLERETTQAQADTTIAQAQLAQMQSMQADIDQYKQDGARKVVLPKFDNTTPLMARLNSVLRSTDDMSLNFDAIDETQAVVQRGVTISFRCGSLAKARSIMRKLEQNTFACAIDSMSMQLSDVTAAAASQRVAVSLHVVFFERNPNAAAASEGQVVAAEQGAAS